MASGEQWEPCPSGLIHGMIRRQRASRRRRMLERAALPMALALLFSVGYLATHRAEPASSVDQISCVKAVERFADYQGDRLDAESTAEVARHLEECPRCREKYQQRFPQEAIFIRRLPAPLVAAQGF